MSSCGRSTRDADCATSDGSATGWLIFGSGPSELGVHPTRSEWDGQIWESTRHVEISFMCDDIHKTMADLRAKGVEMDAEPKTQSYGVTTMLYLPGGCKAILYQPRHAIADPGAG